MSWAAAAVQRPVQGQRGAPIDHRRAGKVRIGARTKVRGRCDRCRGLGEHRHRFGMLRRTGDPGMGQRQAQGGRLGTECGREGRRKDRRDAGRGVGYREWSAVPQPGRRGGRIPRRVGQVERDGIAGADWLQGEGCIRALPHKEVGRQGVAAARRCCDRKGHAVVARPGHAKVVQHT